MVKAVMDGELRGAGDASRLMRSLDWAATPLGPVAGWSQALRTMVGVLSCNRSPLLLWWGPELVQLYNDAFRPILGGKHPRAMGQTAANCFREIWHVVGPMIEAPFRGEPATTSDDLVLLLERRGFLEEAHFDVAYSPVPDATVASTGIGGVLGTCAETTERVYGERQLRTLRELGARVADARTAEQVCASAAETLAENTWDVPFALFYLFDEQGKHARLVAKVGFGDEPARAAPAAIELTLGDATAVWPLGSVVRGQTQVFEPIDARLGALPSGRWSTSPRSAIALSLQSPAQRRACGVLICGVSPHRALDDSYRGFFELAAAQVATAIRDARVCQEESRRVEALADIDRAKATFFNQVSHELRTPLTLILSPLEEALASPQRSLSGEDLDVTYRSTRRLLKLVNTLLDFARIEAAGVQASFEPLDLSVITAELASLFRSTLERAGLRFSVRCDPMAELAFVDREMWEKIVLNLLSNAYKFTFEGEIELTLRLEGDRVQLAVRDTGIGIRPEDQARLFQRFHRVESARSRPHEGSGVGLALVRELVRMHGGEVRVESDFGHGSLFTVELRLGSAHLPPENISPERRGTNAAARAEAFSTEAERWPPDDAPPSPRPPHAGAERSEASVRILVADDNSDMRAYLTRMLRDRWTVLAVADGAEALRAAREWQPDVVLTDVVMPGLSGLSLLGELRKDPRTRTCSVMLLSARAGDESRLDGLDAGADDYVTKPFSARELIARVATQVQSARPRKVAEAERVRLFSFLMQLPVAIAACEGPNHVVALKNPLVDALTRGRLRVGDTLCDLCLELSLDGVIELLDRIYASGEASVWREQPLSFEMDDGEREERLYDVALQPIRDVYGEVTGIVAAAYEVSAPLSTRRRKEARRRELAAVMARERAYEVAPVRLPAQALLADTDACEPRKEPAASTPCGTEPTPLPVSAVAPGPVSGARKGPEAPTLEHGQPSDRGLRVLVVDDDRDGATLLEEALVGLGYTVEMAHDGPSALQVAQSFHPHAALVDVGLPGMDGLEVGRRLREAEAVPGTLRLVAITGYGRDSDRRRSHEAGFDLHLVKPVALAALRGAVAGADRAARGALQADG